jgi:hypothetical protein
MYTGELIEQLMESVESVELAAESRPGPARMVVPLPFSGIRADARHGAEVA